MKNILQAAIAQSHHDVQLAELQILHLFFTDITFCNENLHTIRSCEFSTPEMQDAMNLLKAYAGTHFSPPATAQEALKMMPIMGYSYRQDNRKLTTLIEWLYEGVN